MTLLESSLKIISEREIYQNVCFYYFNNNIIINDNNKYKSKNKKSKNK